MCVYGRARSSVVKTFPELFLLRVTANGVDTCENAHRFWLLFWFFLFSLLFLLLLSLFIWFARINYIKAHTAHTHTPEHTVNHIPFDGAVHTNTPNPNRKCILDTNTSSLMWMWIRYNDRFQTRFDSMRANLFSICLKAGKLNAIFAFIIRNINR